MQKPQTYTSKAEVEAHINTEYDTVKIVADAISDGTIDEVATAKEDSAANVVLTNADVVSTHADVVTTAEDVVSTGEDVDLTNADVVLTHADVISTGEDVVSTNADVVTTGNSVSAAQAAQTATEAVYDSFDDRYLGPKAVEPTLDNDGNALLDGALYWNSVTLAMKAWNSAGSEWVNIATSKTVSFYEYTCTTDQTVFTNTDDNALLLSYDPGFIQVTYNGIWLDPDDYTATDGTTITLSAGTTAGDLLKVLVFGTFEVPDTYTIAQADSKFSNVVARNKVQNQDPLSQGTSTRSGMSSTIYTGDGTASLPIANGLDMSTGDFGGLVWIKNRDAADGHILTDSVRGATIRLSSDSTAAEVTDADTLLSFDTTGFTVGADVKVNTNTEDYIAWSFQTTKIDTGLTNRNKAYTAHYNPDLNFSIISYLGDGVDGHEIPHYLPVDPEFSIFKTRDSAVGWLVKSNLFDNDEYLFLNTTAALAASTTRDTIISDTTISIDTDAAFNTSADNYIMYNFASKSGVCKIGKYIGTGAAGNFVSTEVLGGDAFKAAFVMVKVLSAAGNWTIVDTIRGDNEELYADISNAEATDLGISSDANGFKVEGADAWTNALNHEYIFMAFPETSVDSTKAVADYPYATNADTLSVAEDTLISLANGFNSKGQVDTQYQFGAGITEAYGAGHEDKHYFIYTDKTGTLGVSEVRPLSGITRDDADKYGVVSPSDQTLRTTSKHFDYESDSGVALSSGEFGATTNAFKAFNKVTIYNVPENQWQVSSPTTSWLQYKHTEPRILKSWRMNESYSGVTYTPENFTIEGSNDGLNWTAIDSTYTAGGYNAAASNGTSLWGDLQDTSANTTAYLYHRINTTANNGGATYTIIAELEFNTVIAAEYYLIEDAKMYNSSDTAIERLYLGEFKTDSDGDILNQSIINYPIAEQEVSNLTVHEKLTVHGEANGLQFATAWVFFDGTVNPPLIKSSFNIKDIVDLGTATFRLVFETPMDNISYIISGANGNNATFINMREAADALKLNSVDVIGFNAGSAEEASVRMSVLIFGGKKIL